MTQKMKQYIMLNNKCLSILCLIFCCGYLSGCKPAHEQSPLQSIGFYQIDSRFAKQTPNTRFILVEFFDYRCEACASAFPAIKALQSIDPQVEVIYRELPFLGADSEFAARAALAAGLQGKYLETHDALMQVSASLDQNTILSIAKTTGLNLATLANDMQSSFVNKQLFENSLLAAKINLNSTPMYLFARVSWQQGHLQIDKAVLLNGAQTLEQLKNIVVDLNV